MGKFMVAAMALLLVSGCAATGSFPHASETVVALSTNNYLVVKANAVGTSSGFKLLGLLPLSVPRYTAAMSDLYRSSSVHEGRAYALANVIQERSSAYLILFSVPTLTVRADIVEFMDENERVQWHRARLPDGKK